HVATLSFESVDLAKSQTSSAPGVGRDNARTSTIVDVKSEVVGYGGPVLIDQQGRC
ncbi:MAG: hypothetical protein QOG96_6379, partial [Pseudonocardiales bacterium]|nr:hypothetical protein [Pseudonocardiales bacterium]